MSWLFDILAAFGIGLIMLIAALVLVIFWLHNKVRNDPEYKAKIARLHRSYAEEETVIEAAPWFGTTGLDEEVERELPKYLRREFGELLLDDDSLKARDLEYVGRFDEADGVVHYWRIPSRDGEQSFAYVEVTPEGSVCTSWGGREPPGINATNA